MPLQMLPSGYHYGPPVRLTPPVVCPPTPGTLAHSVNPDDPGFTRCHRRTDRMISLDPSLVASLEASGKKRRACRVCNLEEKKARGEA